MSYERATEDLDQILGELRTATAQPPPTPPEPAEGHDPDQTVRATVTPDGRIESVEIGPRAARLNSHEIAERALAAINAALTAQSDAQTTTTPAADTEDRLREAQDQSVRQLTEYTQSLRDLMNSFEPR